MKRAKVLIFGRVQGVSFRSFIKHKAISLNLKGYIKNLSSGEVEAVFQGKDKAVKEILNYCKKGPLASKVIDLKIIEESYKNEFNNFEIRQ